MAVILCANRHGIWVSALDRGGPAGGGAAAGSESLGHAVRRHLGWIGLILAVALVPRVIVLRNTVAPARDALRYWAAEQELAHGPFPEAIQRLDVPPLYPASLIALRSTMTHWLGPIGPEEWLTICQCGSIASYLAFLVAAYLVGAVIWSPPVAACGAIATSILPRQVYYSADVLSDNLFAALWMTAFGLAATVFLRRADRAPHGFALAAGAGLLAGLAFWTRTEGLLLAVLFGAAVMFGLVFERRRVAPLALALSGFALTFGPAVSTYVSLSGHLSPRNSARGILGGDTVAEPVGATAVLRSSLAARAGEEWPAPTARDAPLPSLRASAAKLAFEIGQETRVWLLALAVLGLAARSSGVCAARGGWLVALALGGVAAMLLALHLRAGFLASRYLTPILPFVGMGAAVGIAALMNWSERGPRLPWERGWTDWTFRRARRAAAASAIGIIAAAACVPDWFRPLHPYRDGQMRAAAWLKRHAAPDDLIFDPTLFSAYFANRTAWWPHGNEEPLSRCRYAVIDPAAVGRSDAATLAAIERVAAEGRMVVRFPKMPGSAETGVYIYELLPGIALAPGPSGQGDKP